MRTRQRISTPFYYRLYTGETMMVDEDGYSLGEREITYADPVAFNANVSPASGEDTIQIFGALEQYDKIIETCDMTCPIDERSVLYIDSVPVYDEHEKVWSPYDYIVKRVAKSVNAIRYAVAKVKVDDNNAPVVSA